MKAAVLQAPYKIVIEEIPEPKPGPGEVLVKVKAVGICGSEVHAYQGMHVRRLPPAILGHEFAGEIAALGEGVTRFKTGDRVTVMPQKTCGSCHPCRQGWQNLCDAKLLLGTNKWTGAFAEYIVAPEEVVYRLPDQLTFIHGSLVEPLAVGVHAIRQAEVEIGDRVLVLGAGPIGLMCQICAREAGARDIIVTDLVDFNLQVAKNLGASLVVNNAREDLVARVQEYYGLNAIDVAIIAAGVPTLIEQAAALVRKKGCIVLVGQFNKPGIIDIEKSRLKEQRLVGSSMYCDKDFLTAIDLLVAKAKDFELLITHRISLEDVEKAIHMVHERTEDVLKVIIEF